MKRLLPLVALILITHSCLTPELIPIQWNTSEENAKISLSQFIEQDKIEIYPSCQKENGIEHHVIGVTITNSKVLPKSDKDKAILAKKIAIELYPEIVNFSQYEFIGIIFYDVWNVGVEEHSKTQATIIETKEIKAEYDNNN